MLVLSRNPGDSLGVKLPDGRMVDITVLEVRGDKVRLGISAPEDVIINRAEIWAIVNECVDGVPENG